MDIVSMIIDFENGDLNDVEIIEFFSELIKSGYCWQLQGMYGRIARNLIEEEFLSEEGEILIDLNNF